MTSAPNVPPLLRARPRRLAAMVAAALMAGFAGLMPASPALAQQGGSLTPQMIRISEAEPTRRVEMGFGRSVIVDLPREAKEVFVANPKIANAVVRTARRLFLVAGEVGSTNVIVTDHEGRTIAQLDVVIARDLGPIRAALKSALPHLDITLRPVEEALMLTGSVGSPAEAQQVVDLVRGFVDKERAAGAIGGRSVINALTVRGRDQVMLRVTVAEVQRDVVKQLGIDFGGQIAIGSSVINLQQVNPFSAAGQPLTDNFLAPNVRSGGSNVTGVLRAMERAGVIRTLAEPNLTAISGEGANFLVGGEFPVPVGNECTPDSTTGTIVCRLKIEFKKFGVGLHFTPVVLSEGRISLRLVTEVSELSLENAFNVSGTQANTSLTIPSIKTRRAETTVEIPSGGTLALAGMIQEQTRSAINGVPGAQSIPVLGTLFRSRDYINRQTELVIMVTPLIVRPVAGRELARPDEGFADPSDPSQVLLGRLNRIYGTPGTPTDPRRPLHGRHGFILD